MKLTKRKGFNFFRSYFDVYNELDNDADKIAFIEALLDRQFSGLKPTELTGMAKFAYISQTNSIDSQVKGYEDKTRERLDGRAYYKDDKPPTEGVKLPPAYGGAEPPTEGVKLPPAGQVEEEGEVEEKEKQQTTTVIKEKIDVVDFKNEIAKEENENWRNTWYMKLKVKPKSLAQLLDDFNLHLGIKDESERPKNLRNYKSHFYNWCNVQERYGNLDRYKKGKKQGAL